MIAEGFGGIADCKSGATLRQRIDSGAPTRTLAARIENADHCSEAARDLQSRATWLRICNPRISSLQHTDLLPARAHIVDLQIAAWVTYLQFAHYVKGWNMTRTQKWHFILLAVGLLDFSGYLLWKIFFRGQFVDLLLLIAPFATAVVVLCQGVRQLKLARKIYFIAFTVINVIISPLYVFYVGR